ncbi:MAG: hypothetical protein IRZ08_12510 [Frankia sp.]|nr:hypothetical protein [Frankia sp.]
MSPAERMAIRASLVASMRSEAARADSQVGIVLAGATAGLALVVTAWSPASLPVAVAVFWWAGVSAAVAGVAALGVALCPSIPRQRTTPPAVWHAWHAVDAAAAHRLTGALDATPGDLAAADRQVAELARVVAGKFARVRLGLGLLGVALVVLAVAGVVGQVAA